VKRATAAVCGNSHIVARLTLERDAFSPETLMRLFHLTPAEARLAVELASGRTLQEICAQFGISRATANTQLGAVFRKMEVGRQSELVALLNRGVGRFF
jgi:DNA-binding CsgD family transcriptional regulator